VYRRSSATSRLLFHDDAPAEHPGSGARDSAGVDGTQDSVEDPVGHLTGDLQGPRGSSSQRSLESGFAGLSGSAGEVVGGEGAEGAGGAQRLGQGGAGAEGSREGVWPVKMRAEAGRRHGEHGEGAGEEAEGGREGEVAHADGEREGMLGEQEEQGGGDREGGAGGRGGGSRGELPRARGGGLGEGGEEEGGRGSGREWEGAPVEEGLQEGTSASEENTGGSKESTLVAEDMSDLRESAVLAGYESAPGLEEPGSVPDVEGAAGVAWEDGRGAAEGPAPHRHGRVGGSSASALARAREAAQDSASRDAWCRPCAWDRWGQCSAIPAAVAPTAGEASAPAADEGIGAWSQ